MSAFTIACPSSVCASLRVNTVEPWMRLMHARPAKQWRGPRDEGRKIHGQIKTPKKWSGPAISQVQVVALNGVVVFRGAGRFCCVHCFGSRAMLPHLVPQRIRFRRVRTPVDETSIGQFVALFGACRTISWHSLAQFLDVVVAVHPAPLPLSVAVQGEAIGILCQVECKTLRRT